MADPRSGPKLKIDRAKRHIDELVPLVSRFLATDPYEIVEYVDPETGKNRAKVKIHAEPDPSWSLIIGDAIHNLRSALDILYSQLLSANGVTPKESDGFPIRDSKTLFDNSAGPAIKKRAGRQTFERMRNDVKPYRGGNNALWCLHKLDIVDKHKLLLVVAASNPLLIVSIEDETGKEIGSHAYPTATAWPLKDGDELPGITQVGHFRSKGAPEMKIKNKAAFVVTLYEPSIIEIPEALDVSLANMTGAVEYTVEILGA